MELLTERHNTLVIIDVGWWFCCGIIKVTVSRSLHQGLLTYTVSDSKITLFSLCFLSPVTLPILTLPSSTDSLPVMGILWQHLCSCPVSSTHRFKASCFSLVLFVGAVPLGLLFSLLLQQPIVTQA